MYTFFYYFLIFFIYSFIGWCIEMISCSYHTKKIINRGFLIGPYCPIYGIASILMTSFLTNYKNDLLVLFIMATFICSILEYITSYLMEKLFKARWWDYSNKPFNVNGRVCLINSLYFGILGVLLISVIHPFIINIISSISNDYFYIITTFLFTVFLIDYITSFKITFTLKKSFQNLRKDSTEEISKKIKETISESSKLFTRILDAFPNLKPLNKKKKRSFLNFFK